MNAAGYTYILRRSCDFLEKKLYSGCPLQPDAKRAGIFVLMIG